MTTDTTTAATTNTCSTCGESKPLGEFNRRRQDERRPRRLP